MRGLVLWGALAFGAGLLARVAAEQDQFRPDAQVAVAQTAGKPSAAELDQNVKFIDVLDADLRK